MTDIFIYDFQLAVVAAVLGLALSVYWDGLGYFVFHVAMLAGVGAYTFAVTTITLGMAPVEAIVASVCGAGAVGLLAAEILSGLRRDGLTLATFGMGVAAFELFRFSELTGGVFGLSSIPSFSGKGLNAVDVSVGGGLLLISFAVVWHWRHSLGGKVVVALRMEEWATISLGAPLKAHQRTSGLLSGALAGAAGAYLSATIRFIEPRDFEVSSLLIPLAGVIMASGRTPFTVVVAVFGIVGANQGARFIGTNSIAAGPVTEILIALIVGVSLIALRLRFVQIESRHEQ